MEDCRTVLAETEQIQTLCKALKDTFQVQASRMASLEQLLLGLRSESKRKPELSQSSTFTVSAKRNTTAQENNQEAGTQAHSRTLPPTSVLGVSTQTETISEETSLPVKATDCPTDKIKGLSECTKTSCWNSDTVCDQDSREPETEAEELGISGDFVLQYSPAWGEINSFAASKTDYKGVAVVLHKVAEAYKEQLRELRQTVKSLDIANVQLTRDLHAKHEQVQKYRRAYYESVNEAAKVSEAVCPSCSVRRSTHLQIIDN